MGFADRFNILDRSTWHYGDVHGQYSGPGKVIRDTYLSKAVVDPSGKVHVFFYGTGSGPDSPGVGQEFKEDFAAGAGKKIPAWDKELQWYIDNYGFQSDTVSYTGFSRGGGLAQYMGGIGYGSGHFYQYAARDGSINRDSEIWRFFTGWDVFNAAFHDSVIEPVSNVADTLLGVVGVGSHDRPSACAKPHDITGQPLPTMDVRGRALMARDPDEVKPGTKRKYDDISTDTPTPHAVGGFAGIQRTMYNPVTGRIIGYKGIPRKRRFSTLHKYSPFWKERDLDFMASQRSTQTAS